jgi:hypothetical protein
MFKLIARINNISLWVVSTNPWKFWNKSSLKTIRGSTYNLWKSSWQIFIIDTKSHTKTLQNWANFTKEIMIYNIEIKHTIDNMINT